MTSRQNHQHIATLIQQKSQFNTVYLKVIFIYKQLVVSLRSPLLCVTLNAPFFPEEKDDSADWPDSVLQAVLILPPLPSFPPPPPLLPSSHPPPPLLPSSPSPLFPVSPHSFTMVSLLGSPFFPLSLLSPLSSLFFGSFPLFFFSSLSLLSFLLLSFQFSTSFPFPSA